MILFYCLLIVPISLALGSISLGCGCWRLIGNSNLAHLEKINCPQPIHWVLMLYSPWHLPPNFWFHLLDLFWNDRQIWSSFNFFYKLNLPVYFWALETGLRNPWWLNILRKGLSHTFLFMLQEIFWDSLVFTTQWDSTFQWVVYFYLVNTEPCNQRTQII